MPEVPDTVDDAIEPLSSPSTDEVFEATRPFSAREIASAAASEALSGGGDPFNGGTITEPLQVQTSEPTDVQLLLQGTAGATNNVFEAYPDADDQSHFWVDYHACVFMFNDDEFEESKIEVADNVGGNAHLASLSSWNGLKVSPQPSSRPVALIQPNAGQTGPLLKILDPDFNPVFQVNADGSVHIKTGTSIVADL